LNGFIFNPSFLLFQLFKGQGSYLEVRVTEKGKERKVGKKKIKETHKVLGL